MIEAPLFQGGQVDPGNQGANYSTGSLVSLDGFLAVRRKLAARRKIQIAEAASMWNQFHKGNVHPALMLEAFKPEPADWMFGALNKLAPSDL
jgi:hypothetical protein